MTISILYGIQLVPHLEPVLEHVLSDEQLVSEVEVAPLVRLHGWPGQVAQLWGVVARVGVTEGRILVIGKA